MFYRPFPTHITGFYYIRVKVQGQDVPLENICDGEPWSTKCGFRVGGVYNTTEYMKFAILFDSILFNIMYVCSLRRITLLQLNQYTLALQSQVIQSISKTC